MSSSDIFAGIQAILFDMDGTLVDSELHTGHAVNAVAERAGSLPPDIDPREFWGVTWQGICKKIAAQRPDLEAVCTPEALHEVFVELGRSDPPPPIPGMLNFVGWAAEHFATAIVTSSRRESVDDLLQRFDLHKSFKTTVSSEDYSASKPEPECYLLAASRLGIKPSSCLVFEDSIAGLKAAEAAGMRSVAILHRSPNEELARSLASTAIRSYAELHPETS